jgi:hypothetical protein
VSSAVAATHSLSSACCMQLARQLHKSNQTNTCTLPSSSSPISYKWLHSHRPSYSQCHQTRSACDHGAQVLQQESPDSAAYAATLNFCCVWCQHAAYNHQYRRLRSQKRASNSIPIYHCHTRRNGSQLLHYRSAFTDCKLQVKRNLRNPDSCNPSPLQ